MGSAGWKAGGSRAEVDRASLVSSRVQAADRLEEGVVVVEVGADGLSAMLPREAGLGFQRWVR